MSKPRRFLAPLAAILCLQAVLAVAYSRRIVIFNAADEPSYLRRVSARPPGEPPLYYALSAPFEAPLRRNAPAGRVAALRFLNVLLGLSTTAFVYLFALRAAGERGAVYCAAFSALLPQHLFVSATLGPDELAAALSTAGLWLGSRHLYKRRRAWLGPAVGLILGLGQLARAGAWATTLAYAACAAGQSRRERGAGRLIAIPLGVALLVSAWFYRRSALLTGGPLGFGPSDVLSGLSRVDAAWLAAFAQSLVGLFAWNASPIPAAGYVLAFAALAAGAAGFALWARAERPWHLEPAWTLALAALATTAVWAALEALAARRPDGRLLLPAIGPIALVLVCGWRFLARGMPAGPRAKLRAAAAGALVLLHYWAFRAL